MKINSITLSDLRRMNGKEGLILQGCGGEIKEWMDGINKMLTDKGILLDNTKFEHVSVYFIHLPMSTLTSASLQCGDYSHTQHLPELGFPTMWKTSSVDLLPMSKSKQKRSNLTVR